MAGGGTARSFEVLPELRDVHTQELASQRAQYELQLGVLRRENESLRSRLVDAKGAAASSVPSLGIETTVEHSSEASPSAEANASPFPTSDAAPRANPGAPPPAAGLAVPAAQATHTTPGVCMPTDADPAVASPPPGADARESDSQCWLWEVIGGEGQGGVLVPDGESLSSPQLPDRLFTGSTVKGNKLNGDRLHFKRIGGVGPQEGWISTKLHGKGLVAKGCQVPLKPRLPPPMAVGPSSEEPLPAVFFFQDIVPLNVVSDLYLDMPEMKEMLDKAWPIITSHILTDRKLEMAVLRAVLLSFISILAGLERLKVQRRGVLRRASAMAGIGTGQYIALYAAGVLSFEDGLKLVLARFTALIAAAGHNRECCTMVVHGLEQETPHSICLQACKTKGTGEVCKITAYMSHDCFWVGGTSWGMSLVRKEAVNAGAKVDGLRFQAPHTPLMRNAQAEFVATLEEVLPSMRPPLHTVWMNPTAVPARPGCDPGEIVAHLKHEVERPVLVSQCADAMREEGLRQAYHFQVPEMTWVPSGFSELAEWFDLDAPYTRRSTRLAEG